MERRWPRIVLGIATGIVLLFAVVLLPFWRRSVVRAHLSQTAEPFRIAGNLYYVGGSDATSFLLTGPEGHVLIDGGFTGSTDNVVASIAKLGFNIRDVKILLNAEPHAEQAGGLAELQRLSGAELWVSEASARTIASGGDDANFAWPIRAFVWAGILSYPAPRIDHRFRDGDIVRLGPLALTANITGVFTRGCTTWSFTVNDRGRDLLAARICSLSMLPGMSLVTPETYRGIRADIEHTFQRLRSLPVDIFLTEHARDFGRYPKYLQSRDAADPALPFIDRDGYRSYLDRNEAGFRKVLAAQQRRASAWGPHLSGLATRLGWQ